MPSRCFRLLRAAVAIAAGLSGVAMAAEPVYIGLDEAYSITTSISPKAIERGARAALEEINARGGVLDGRPLRLLVTDNQGVAARGRDNFIELAGKPGIIAVLAGKYSPITVETVPEAARLQLPLVSVWGSADPITEHAASPSFTFRLALKDSWGVEAMMARARTAHQASRVCAVVPNTSWGRSAQRVLTQRSGAAGVALTALRWYNWGDQNFAEHLDACVRSRAQAIVLVANEREAAFFIKQLAQMPANLRLPVISHWGVSGGVLHELAGQALDKVDLQVIQTFTFVGNPRPQARRLAQWILRDGSFTSVEQIPGPAGSAQAYDMVHLLAMAVDQAGSTRGDDIRRALESLPPYDGAVRRYAPAFTATRHDALTPREVLFVRIDRSGALLPVR